MEEKIFFFAKRLNYRADALRKMRDYLGSYCKKRSVCISEFAVFITLLTEIGKNIWDHSKGGRIRLLFYDDRIEFFSDYDLRGVSLEKKIYSRANQDEENFGLGLQFIRFLASEQEGHEQKIKVIEGNNFVFSGKLVL